MIKLLFKSILPQWIKCLSAIVLIVFIYQFFVYDSFLSSTRQTRFRDISFKNRIQSEKSKNKVQDFKILHNYIPSDVQQNVEPFTAYNDTVTYTTQASYDFLQHSIELCRRFDGPISLAVYCPGTEFLLTVRLIHRLRQCDHSCVRNNISWHLVFDHQYRPDLLNEQQTWHQFLINNEINTSTDCTEPYSVFSDRLIGQYFPNKSEHNNVLNFRTQKGLPYPINVLRNAARQSASTRYVLASDIELYPSLNVVSMFGKLLARERANQLSLVDSQKPHVYVLPIFEVKSTVKAPETKSQLISMLTSGDAIPFHKWVCETCQQFVDREKWANETVNVNELNIFRKTRRYKSYWEPLYIGTNDEPFYEERINWDGKLDKMTQMLEMCLMGYEMLILDNAFLVHAPGIKYVNAKDDQKRKYFMKQNQNIYYSVSQQLYNDYMGFNQFFGEKAKC